MAFEKIYYSPASGRAEKQCHSNFYLQQQHCQNILCLSQLNLLPNNYFFLTASMHDYINKNIHMLLYIFVITLSKVSLTDFFKIKFCGYVLKNTIFNTGYAASLKFALGSSRRHADRHFPQKLKQGRNKTKRLPGEVMSHEYEDVLIRQRQAKQAVALYTSPRLTITKLRVVCIQLLLTGVTAGGSTEVKCVSTYPVNGSEHIFLFFSSSGEAFWGRLINTQ